MESVDGQGSLFPEQQPTSKPESADSMTTGGEERFAISLLALGSIKGLGIKGIKALYDLLDGNLDGVWGRTEESLHEALAKARTPGADAIVRTIFEDEDPLKSIGQAQFMGLQQRQISVIAGYKLPQSLQGIPDPPRWLFVEGRPDVLYKKPMVAVVGTRQPTENGLKAAGIIAQILSAYPITLVSGLAEGIDERAHSISLQNGVTNIAFLGHGINLIFPDKTKELRERIVLQGGAVVTEYLPNERYQKSRFVERNRLQAGLADVVIPVEGGVKSGTAHTVRFAKQLSRPLLSIHFPGCNGLAHELCADGYPAISIGTPSGMCFLDGYLRKWADIAGHETYALRLAEQRLFKEFDYRDIQSRDIEKLVKNLMENIAKYSEREQHE